MFNSRKTIIYAICVLCVILFLLIVYKKLYNFASSKIPDKIAILYCGNIDKTLKNWPTVIETHIFIYQNIFPNKKLDLFFVVDDIEPKKLLINDFLRENTINIICTNTPSVGWGLEMGVGEHEVSNLHSLTNLSAMSLYILKTPFANIF